MTTTRVRQLTSLYVIWTHSKALSTLATTVAEFGDCCRIRRQIVAVSGDYNRRNRRNRNRQIKMNPLLFDIVVIFLHKDHIKQKMKSDLLSSLKYDI